ncbi:MAG: alpha/beta hydrolase [Acidobacteriota bacterium]|nr:alpha/beta hydrolase [Acidobacteriota bacterium]
MARRGALLAALIGLLLCAVAWPFAKAHLQAVAVMRKVSGQPVPMFARQLMVAVTNEDVSFPIATAGGPVRARMYLPQGEPNAPAMVIFHGVHHLGIDEPRLMDFAAAIASCGIRVLTPELPGIKDYHVSADSVQTIAESVKWYAGQTGGPVGVMGLSFSGGLALVAAADPNYHADFKFVLAVGSQDSMARVTDYYRTGRDVRPDGSVEVLAAHEYGPLVLEYEHLADFVPAVDLEPVRAVMRAHLYEDTKAEAHASLALNEKQKLETLDLMDAASTRTRARIAALTKKHTDELPGLSPLGRLQTLGTPVYLLHGEADNIIPSAETLWMASELREGDLQAVLVSPVLSHVGLDRPSPGPMDNWRLVHFFALVMRAAKR